MSPSAPEPPKRIARLRPLRRLLPFLAPYRGILLGACAALVVAAGATLSMPVALRLMIDQGFDSTDPGHIDRHFLILFAVASVLALASAVRYYLVTWIGERLVTDLRKAVYTHTLGMSPVFFESTRTGEILSRLTTDTTLIQTVIGSTVSVVLRNLLILVGGILMLLVTSPQLTGMILLLIPLVLIPVLGFGRQVRALSRSSQDRLADTSSLAQQVLSAIQTVQSYTREGFESGRYATAVESAFSTAKRRMRSRAILTALAIFLMFGAIVLVLWFGARAVIAGEMSAGLLGQFLLYALFTGGAMAALSESWGEIQRAAGATERLIELLDAKPAIHPPAAPRPLPTPLRGALHFEAVDFAYPSHPERRVLSQFELRIEPGETVALVGPSGAGKTTVFQLLMRFYDPQSGRITLDGTCIADCDPGQVRAQIAIVPQDPVLFADSALENIRYGRIEASDEAVRAAAQHAAAAEFIEAQPGGYDSFLGERGVRLSGGQKQRIAIARAMLKDAPVVLLDEATSALDAHSETLVQQALAELTGNRTTLVIAHRLATVREADRIVVMDGGRILAQGRHEQLMREGGLYARLARLQFREERGSHAGPSVVTEDVA